MLDVRALNVYYGAVHALKGVDLSVKGGEIVTLIGANGAGKSTLLRTISGLLRPRTGAITFAGIDLVRLAPNKVVAAGISHAPEGRAVFANLTVEDNLMLGAYLRKDGEVASDMNRMFGIFPRLKERRKQAAGTLSGGEQQMLAIARALMSRPRLLLLDEPSLGLAPLLVKDIFATIVDINREGMTILLVEQNANQALHVAHRGYVLETGRVALSDTGPNLLANPAVKEAYLGG
ncbi:MAG: ABC transporter ATP-binding protein [Candidatus Eisenbacteria bacterium]